MFWVKHSAHKIAESLRATSVSKLDNMVSNNYNNNNSIFKTKYVELFTKW